MTQHRLRFLGVVAALAVAAACSDSTGPGGARTVALVVHTSFVDYDTANYGSEASNLEHTLKSFGVQVNPIGAAYDSTTIAGILAVSQALIFPEAFSAIPESLSIGTLALIRNWVDSGGGVLIVNPESDNIALLDSLFNYALISGGGPQSWSLNAGAASGTAFAGGPSLIWDNNGTHNVTNASLPVGGLAIYTDGADATVSVIPQGNGTVVLIGWDWYNAAPHGSQDGGWLEVLRRALRS